MFSIYVVYLTSKNDSIILSEFLSINNEILSVFTLYS